MRAFGSALGTTAVTLGGLAGATLLVSSAGMLVVRRVVKHQEVRTLQSQPVCMISDTLLSQY